MKNLKGCIQLITSNSVSESGLFNRVVISLTLLFILNPVCFSQPRQTRDGSSTIPEMVIPVYNNLKSMYIDIPLVVSGKPVCSIVTPEIYNRDARVIQDAVEKVTGVRLPVIRDTDPGAALPFTGNMIILGNRSTSEISRKLYDLHYSLMDLKYPGSGGYAVRSLHNPFGNGFSAILAGGSDATGVAAGALALASELSSLPGSPGNLNAGWTMLTRLGEGLNVPENIREFVTWEGGATASHYGFSWNSISVRMAAYYMTGDPFHAREVMRLSFPDEQALKEIDEIDGERIENKNDPLAGPYHYNATKTVLFWDLIEESPVFTDSERLKATNAFARRLDHEGTTPFDKNTYRINTTPSSVSSRHGQWSALSVYVLGRYFNKYYPSPMWAQAERAGRLSFQSLHQHAWVQGEGDQLGWYCTGIYPVLTYMILTGDRIPVENGVLRELLQGLEVLITGQTPEWALTSAAFNFFNKAAYLTGDGRWLTYRNRLALDGHKFRVGQSFWVDDAVKPIQPEDLIGRWLVHHMPEGMWKSRNIAFPLKQAFQNMSYRNMVDGNGDYLLLKGYNGAYRNPYHTCAIVELRLNGSTVMKGFNNQVLSSADGMVEPVVAMDAALIHSNVTGKVAAVTAEVPNLPFVTWRRSIALRTGKYVLIADNFTFRGEGTDAQKEMLTRLETCWEMPGVEWTPGDNFVTINPGRKDQKSTYELHSSEIMDIKPGRVTTMLWQKPTRDGEKRTFFHLLGQIDLNSNKKPACLSLDDNSAVLILPETALAVSGKYGGVDAELAILGENSLYGNGLRSVNTGRALIRSDRPVEIDWDFTEGRLSLTNSGPVQIALAVSSPELSVNNKRISGKKEKGLYVYNLDAGRHDINGAVPSPRVRKAQSAELRRLLKLAQQQRARLQDMSVVKAEDQAALWNPVMKADIGGRPVESILIPAPQGELIGTATGNTVIVLNSEGKEVRRMNTPGEVRVLHWWAEPKLLLAGCVDEQVIAFNEQGQKIWEFTSVMDPAVYEAGKPYWFKSAYPGVWGLYSGDFDNGKNRLFIGSACTLEVLDEKGQLVRRIPVFWGPGRQFFIVNASDGSKNLLVGRWPNDWETMAVINSKDFEVIGSGGYRSVPPGHTYVRGWTAMNRFDNFLTDMDGDGNRELVSAINGTWNRITVYSEDGNALYNRQIGPGLKEPRANIRMMDVGDLTGDGKQEIAIGLSSGFVNVLDGKTGKLWSKLLESPPMVVRMVKESGMSWICVGCEDGTVLLIDESGNILKKGKVTGKPADIRILNTTGGNIAVIMTDKGETSGFRLR